MYRMNLVRYVPRRTRLKFFRKNVGKVLKNSFFLKKAFNFKLFSTHLVYNNKKYLLTVYSRRIEYLVTFCSYLVYTSLKTKNYILPTLLNLFSGYRFIFFTKPLRLLGFFQNQPNSYIDLKILLFNFRRGRFFPSIQTFSGETYANFSLGLFAVFLKKGKFFIKNKSVFLLVASFLRKILLFSLLRNLLFIVKKTPLYLQELLTTLNTPVINYYKHPYKDDTVNENTIEVSFRFFMCMFINNRAYGIVKLRKKGRVKRKIAKRVVSINRLID